MKKKIILTLTACLFAAGTIINMHLAQNNHNTDISLADISVMAQADGESGGGTAYCCPDVLECIYDRNETCLGCGGAYGTCIYMRGVANCGPAGTCTLWL